MRRRITAPWVLASLIACFFLAVTLVACGPATGDDPNEVDDPVVPEAPAQAGEPDVGFGEGPGKGSEVICGGHGIGIDPDLNRFTDRQVSTAYAELELMRESLWGSVYICAIAMMGYATGDLEEFLKGSVRNFPVVAAIPDERWVEAEGDEVYLVIPRDNSASITVSEWSMSPTSSTGPYEGEPGDVLYRENGEPFIVRGNLSDISPNLMIEISEMNGDSIRYIPFCNLMDGTLDVPPGSPSIFDCTLYPSLCVPPADVAGDWSSFWGHLKGGEYVSCALSIGEGGSLSYAWGPADEVYENYYEGSWKPSPLAGQGDVPHNAVVFDLDLVEGSEGAVKEIEGTFALTYYSEVPGCLYVVYLDGEPLTYSQRWDGSLEFEMAFG